MLKSARSVLSGQAPTNDTTKILTDYRSRQEIGCAFDIIGNDADIVSAYAWRSAFLTFEALKHRDEQKKPWNDLLVDFYRLRNRRARSTRRRKIYSGSCTNYTHCIRLNKRDLSSTSVARARGTRSVLHGRTLS